MVLGIAQGLRRRHDDAIAGMHAHRVYIFHIAHDDAGAVFIPHHLVFDFFPARNALFDEALVHAGQVQAVGANLRQLAGVVRDAAARAAQCISRPHDHGISHLFRKGQGLVHLRYNLAFYAGLTDFFHRFLERLAVLCLADGIHVGAQKPHTLLFQKAAFRQLHGKIQPRLPAEGGQDAVRLFLADDVFNDLGMQRLQVHFVRNVGIRHDGSRVGIDEHYLDALFLQRSAGLCARIVKLCSLADDDGAAADDQYFFDILTFWHGTPPYIIATNLSNR